MIKSLDKKSTWDTKYVPNFKVVRLLGRRKKVNISDIHKILPADFIVSCILDEQIFAQEGQEYKWPTYTERGIGHRLIPTGLLPRCMT